MVDDTLNQRTTSKPRKARSSKAHPLRDVLNPKQQAFIAFYISNGWNGTQAAVSAGYKHPSVVASQLLRKVKVRNEIDAALRNHRLCASQVLARLSEMANASIGDFMDDNGDIALSKVKKSGHLLKRFERKIHINKDGNKITKCEIEPHDSLAALILVGKYHGLFTAKTEVKSDQHFDFTISVTPEEMP